MNEVVGLLASQKLVTSSVQEEVARVGLTAGKSIDAGCQSTEMIVAAGSCL